MQYREDKHGNKLSILGYGCMRFTKKGNKIDLDKAERELLYAIKQGVNYLDTAYIYGGSEAALGEILERNRIRDKVFIATKLPQYMVKSVDGAEKIFQEELRRLRTDHVDYYLMHMLSDVENWERLKSIGIDKWIEKKKESGQIRNIGFSFHGTTSHFLPLLDAHDWDFCQIQYNYLDEHTQAGRKGLEYAGAKGIPVIIMEPLRGGKLVNDLPKKAREAIAADAKKRSAAELALRWLWNQPQVTCVLSGMNSLEMVQENVRIASDVRAGEFTDGDFALISRARSAIMDGVKIGCTGCGYCQPCPKNIGIPQAFQSYNLIEVEGKSKAWMEYFQNTALRSKTSSASQCVGCGKCEEHCPQHLPIRQYLKDVEKTMETPTYRIAKKIVKLLHLY